MLNLYRYIKFTNRYIIKINRYLSLNKSNLIESSQKIQILLKSTNDKSSLCKWFYESLEKIHEEYPSTHVATSTKRIYEKNSSKLNSVFIELENNRKLKIGDFKEQNVEHLIILLRYVRYLEICFIYRLITYDIDIQFKELLNSIIYLTKNQNYFNEKYFFLIDYFL